MLLAALYQGRRSKHFVDRSSQGFGAIDHPQARCLGIQAPLDEIGKERTHHARVLGAALSNSQDMFLSLVIDSQSNEHLCSANNGSAERSHGRKLLILIPSSRQAAWSHASQGSSMSVI
jgi:hypothetical protein